MNVKIILNDFCTYHLFFSFIGLWIGLVGGLTTCMLCGILYPFWILFAYCGLSGIILAFTDKYWDKEKMEKKN